MLHGRRNLPQDNIVSLSRYNRNDGKGEYLNKELEYLKYRLSLGSGVVFPFITDTHPASGSTKRFSIFSNKEPSSSDGTYDYNSKQFFPALERATGVILKLAETNKVDCCVIGGDYLQGTTTAANYLTTAEGQSEILGKLTRKMPVLMVKGNHDFNVSNSKVYTPEYANAVNKYLSFSQSVVYDENEVDGNGNMLRTYGYYDNEDEKVRIIFLNIYDHPWTSIGRDRWFMGSNQLAFLKDRALNFGGKTGWKIIVCSHTYILHSVARESSNTYSSDYAEDVLRMFLSFQYGLSGTFRGVTNSDYYIQQFSYDFTSNTTNKIFCFICGHTHESRSKFCFYYYNKTSTALNERYRLVDNVYVPITEPVQGFDFDNRYYHYADDGNGNPLYKLDTTNRYYLSCVVVESYGQPSGEIYNDTSMFRDYNTIGSYSRNTFKDAIYDIVQYESNTDTIYFHRVGLGESRKYIKASNGLLIFQSKKLDVTVTNGSNPIEGATVIVELYSSPHVNCTTGTTNSSGIVSFFDFPLDKCKVTVSAIGYNDNTVLSDDVNETEIEV